MGFGRGYVEGTLPHKMSPQVRFTVGGCMLRKTLCVHVLVMLRHSLLEFVRGTGKRERHKLVKPMSEAPRLWLLHHLFVEGTANTPEAQDLVTHFCRRAERGGSDMRLDVGVPFRARTWPRVGIKSSLFHWSVVHGCVWTHSAHINVLELQAVINGVQWRLRTTGNGRCCVFHLFDNQVVCSIISKGRSSNLKRGL